VLRIGLAYVCAKKKQRITNKILTKQQQFTISAVLPLQELFAVK